MHQPSASLLEDSLLRSKGHLRRSTRRRNADLGGGGGWIGLSSLAALLVTLVGSVLGFGLYAGTHRPFPPYRKGVEVLYSVRMYSVRSTSSARIP